MPTASSSIFSRILFLLGGLVVIGMAAWFIQTSLAPIPAPPFVPPRKTVSFDAKLDVSKNEIFFRLRPLGPMESIQPQTIGRANPFDPAPPSAPIPTSTSPTTSSVSSNETSSTTSTTAFDAATSSLPVEQPPVPPAI